MIRITGLKVLLLLTVYYSLSECIPRGNAATNKKFSGRYNSDEFQLLDEIPALRDDSADPYVYETKTLPPNPKFYPSVGNGHLGHTIYRDAVFVNGIYSGELGWSHRARFPAVHESNFTVQSTTSSCTIGTWTHTLNLRDGTFTQRISFQGVNITYLVYAHQFYNRILVTELTLERNPGCGDCCDEEIITVVREALSTEPTKDFDLGAESEYNPTNCIGECRTQSGTIKEKEVTSAPLTNATTYWHTMPDTYNLTASGTLQHFYYVLAIDQTPAVAKANFDAALQILSTTPADLLANHKAAFNQVWDKGSIDVKGDIHLDKVIHGCLYYLYTSLPAHPTFSENNQFYALSPGGLPNGANNTDYQGHVFWDMETWMYPPILMFRPDLAVDMLSYRIHGMDYAKERAVSGGYEGARFPWESAFTGVEVTPDICPACRENQQHITGDIAYAARQYISTTWDLDWLTTAQAGTLYTGLDFITEMARFWQSRPKYNESTQRYDINGVMPPDEHQEHANNSIYTNVVASYAIHFARYANCYAINNGAAVPDSWINIAQNLAFTYQREKRYHEEFAGYDYEIATNTSDPRGVKQADVVMLGFPYHWSMPDDVRRNDLTWYETVTHPQGPAMTWGIHSIGWLDLGNFIKADELFNHAYVQYAREPFKVWTEVQSGDGAVNFITGMGGFLQSVLFGYGGLRLDIDELRFNKGRLPPNTTEIIFRNLHYLGTTFDFKINETMVTVTVVTTGRHDLHLITSSDSTRLTNGVVKSLPPQAFTIKAAAVPACQIRKPEINVDYSSAPASALASRDHIASQLSLAVSALITAISVTML